MDSVRLGGGGDSSDAGEEVCGVDCAWLFGILLVVEVVEHSGALLGPGIVCDGGMFGLTALQDCNGLSMLD